MAKNMQMPEKFIADVFKLICLLEDVELNENARTLCKSLDVQIKAKLEAMDRRKTFSEYKTAVPGHLREQKRVEYIEKAEIHKNWQTREEKPYSEK